MKTSILMILVSVTIAVTGQFMLKSGMNSVGRIGADGLHNLSQTVGKVATTPLVVGGLTLYVLSAVIWLVVLSRERLSFAYPLIGVSYIVVVFLSRLVYGDEVSPLKWVGVLLISAGVVFVTRS